MRRLQLLAGYSGLSGIPKIISAITWWFVHSADTAESGFSTVSRLSVISLDSLVSSDLDDSFT